MREFELHPGDRLACLGYPLGAESNDAGIPMLRSGYIASFPLIPAATVRSFLFDFNVFEGNSGGPVYFVESNRSYGGTIHFGTVNFLVGLVSEQRFAEEQIKSLTELRTTRYRLGLAVVIHAALIREALNLLPRTPRWRTNRWTRATGSDFRIKRDPAQLLASAVTRSTQTIVIFLEAK